MAARGESGALADAQRPMGSSAPAAPAARPQGRAPRDHTWDAARGAYVHNETGAVHVKGERSAASAAQQKKRERDKDERNENAATKAARALRTVARRHPMPLVTLAEFDKLASLHKEERARCHGQHDAFHQSRQQWVRMLRRGGSYPPRAWSFFSHSDKGDGEEFMAVESARDLPEDGQTMRAVVMHKRWVHGRLYIEVEDGSFDRDLRLQRGVRTNYLFNASYSGGGVFPTVSDIPIDCSVEFVVDGDDEVLEPEDAWSLDVSVHGMLQMESPPVDASVWQTCLELYVKP